jgi:ribonuclease D
LRKTFFFDIKDAELIKRYIFKMTVSEISTPSLAYTIIENDASLIAFCENNKTIEWMAVDTEFIGERRYETLLCLIQVATAEGYYLIDPIRVTNLKPFLDLIESPLILKITHAGENDYRLLNQNWGIIPQNLFDTQVAAGFIGLGYPISYAKLVEKELDKTIDKGYAATDWEARPLKTKQVEYALSDVTHLKEIFDSQCRQLKAKGRFEWVVSEMKIWETPQYYKRDPHKEALMNTMMQSMRAQKQIFLLRLYEWRRSEAQRLNYSKEMILPAKFISPIVKSIDNGKQALLDSRIIPDRLVEQNWKTFRELYENKTTPEEFEILKRLPPSKKEDPKREVAIELLHILVKFKCMESGIAPQLVMNKSDLAYLQPGEALFASDLNDWRKDFLGEALLQWLNGRGELKVSIEHDKVVVTSEVK